MLVVSNTSPLSDLAIIGRLGLLKDRYGSLTIPQMVKTELDALDHEAGRRDLEAAFGEGWIAARSLPQSLDLSHYLERADPGECEAIALAEILRADKILLDDRVGRELARERNLKVSGVLGELLHAKDASRIVSVREEIDRLQSEARFFISADLKALILSSAGE
jgi:predicted nucleic acid-binding protein